MNKLQLRAARLCAANATVSRNALNPILHLSRHTVSPMSRSQAAVVPASPSLHAHWVRNAITGTLECVWASEAVAEPPMRTITPHGHATLRVLRHIRRKHLRLVPR
ncbi:hypothetical protein FHW69_003166 [Luteibacter sp. Sphag1AF]|uniref:hypothetical protein n=1 Tax=Luteibacter sp. Sphag1AF TaxID=2587031 RepID=UPI0016171CB3|nr:hypothetical protein [Luteibacter sp. Sphag1AF]MBB3228524.1 hypothetical protein [Luteibacter sp. Sphag1AF]